MMQLSTNKDTQNTIVSYYIRAFASVYAKIYVYFNIITFIYIFTSNYLFYTVFHQNIISLSIFYYYLKSSLSSTTKNHCSQCK